MRKLAIAAALASTVMATPAVARDKSFYVGLQGGVMWVEDVNLDYSDAFSDFKDAFTVTHKSGFDVDLIGGYDFGVIRLEGELAYKRARINQIIVIPQIAGGGPGDNYDAGGRASVTSAMINALLDYGNEDGLSGYAGVGVGIAGIRYRASAETPFTDIHFSDNYSGLAWQGILGLNYAITPNFDLGMKYRYFSIPNVKFSSSDEFVGGYNLKGNYRSHSLMLSLIYNFAAPPPPPPPPPPPATQTCPDGSVILATDSCPLPPPPPPPPPPAPERGL